MSRSASGKRDSIGFANSFIKLHILQFINLMSFIDRTDEYHYCSTYHEKCILQNRIQNTKNYFPLYIFLEIEIERGKIFFPFANGKFQFILLNFGL